MVQMRMEGFKKVKPTDDMERVIEKDDSNSSMTTEYDDAVKTTSAACNDRLRRFVNSTRFQVAVVVLIFVVGVLVVAELLITLNVLELYDDVHSVVPRVLHCLVLAILSLFVVEVVMKLSCMRLDYVRDKMEAFDGVVVVATFVLGMPFSSNESFHSSICLLVLLRLWRIVKILNGIILSVKIEGERKLRHERRVREAMEQELAKFRKYCACQEKEIELLQAVLRKHDISFCATEKPVAVETISVVAEVNSIHEEQDEFLNESHNLRL